MNTVRQNPASALAHTVHYRQGLRSCCLAEWDARETVKALLEIRVAAGQAVDCDAESRAILAARNLTHDLLAGGGNGFRALDLLAILDVLDFWLDGCTHTQLHAQWARIAVEVAA